MTDLSMARAFSTFRFLADVAVPGGLLVFAAWAVQTEEVVQRAAAPYTMNFCVGGLAAALLLGWYYDHSRLVCSTAAIILTVLALGQTAAESIFLQRAAVILLPLNLSLLAILKEHGLMARDGLLKVAIVTAQPVGVLLMADRIRFNEWGTDAWPATWQIAFAIGAIILLTLVFIRRTKVEQGLFWALVAMFFGIDQRGVTFSGATPDALYLYSGVAGVIMVFAVLEHGYDIAYRDELTGLAGRRAFNKVMEQLGGRYALAMCDVDHFKQFNDTYGHDAGDQVLRMVAAKLSHVGGGGQAFRYGGEEFLVVFRGRSAREAEPFVEALRRSVAAVEFVLRGKDRPPRKPRKSTAADPNAAKTKISISIGIAERSTRHSTPELVLDAADAALYRAKQAGRNCLKIDESTPSASSSPSLMVP